MSLVYLVVLPILASFLTPFYKNSLRSVSVLLHLILLYIIVQFSFELPIKEFIGFNSPLSITFVLDNANLLFAFLFIIMMLLFSLFHLESKNNKAIFITTNTLIAGVLGLILSIDIFNIYIFFELASISAYILSSLNQDKKAYAAAIKYMIIGSIASIFLLLAIILIYINIGSLNLYFISENFYTIDTKVQFLILLSFFIGFGIKAEIFPLNFWVIDIYDASESSVASLFSSILSKAYIFVFFSLVYILQINQKLLGFLVVVGLISFVVAEIAALKTQNLKKLFAYSTLGQLGLLFLAFSTKNELVITGAFYLVVMDSIAKLMIFLSLDILEKKFDSLSLDIFRKFQSLFLLFIFSIGFLSILGVPPFGGFIAKLTILKGLIEINHIFIIITILTISIVEAVYFFRLLSLNKNSSKEIVIKVPFLQKIVLGLLAFSLLYFGLQSEMLLSICQDASLFLLGGFDV